MKKTIKHHFTEDLSHHVHSKITCWGWLWQAVPVPRFWLLFHALVEPLHGHSRHWCTLTSLTLWYNSWTILMLLFCFSAICLHSLQRSLLYTVPQENATPHEFSGSYNQGPRLSATQECTNRPLYNIGLLCEYKLLYESTKVFPALPLHIVHRGET